MTRVRALGWLTLALMLAVGRPTLAQGVVQDIDCDDFVTQLAAQALLDENDAYAEALDQDNDGIACESLPATRGGDRVRGGTAVSTVEPAASPTAAEPESTATPMDDVEVEATLQGRLGGSRETFEAEYGAAVSDDDDGDVPPVSEFYDVPGFVGVEVAYHDDFIRAMVLDLAIPVDVETAASVVERFLPLDFVPQGTIADPQSDNVLGVGTSAAIGARFSAETYELYNAPGEPGDLFYQFRLNDDGLVVAIDIALGDNLPGAEPDGAATPDDATPETTTMDASAYLATARAQYDDVIASMGVFAALIGAPPDQPEESYRDALLAESAIWQEAYDQATELAPPVELEQLHTSYLAFLELMNEAAENISAGISEDDPGLIDEGINRVIEATALIEGLDQAFAEAEAAA